MNRVVCNGKGAIATFLVVSCVSFAESRITLPSVEAKATPTEPSVKAKVTAAKFAKPLSNTALAKYQTEFKQWIQSDLDLLGLGKITRVAAPIPPALVKFRRDWAKTNAEVAPFLGSWARDWNLHPHDFMTVFPSKTLRQVCLIRTRRDMTETVPFREITTPPEFSIAKVVKGQLLGTKTQSGRSLLFPTPASAYLPYNTEFLGTVDPNKTLRLYAIQGLPSVDPKWNNNIRQQLKAYGCIK
ncbi:MAG TPA: hypothetical protein VK184_21685 [Nostocaceae cyanobacterium]|nr:hypothetical protein [Nostocaceae cyanobacterium]